MSMGLWYGCAETVGKKEKLKFKQNYLVKCFHSKKKVDLFLFDFFFQFGIEESKRETNQRTNEQIELFFSFVIMSIE